MLFSAALTSCQPNDIAISLVTSNEAVAAAATDPAQYTCNHLVESRPHLDNPADLEEMWNMLSAMKFAVAIIDPLIPGLLRLSAARSRIPTRRAPRFHRRHLPAVGTTPIFVHHVSKVYAEREPVVPDCVTTCRSPASASFARSWALAAPHDPTISLFQPVNNSLRDPVALAGYESQWNLLDRRGRTS